MELHVVLAGYPGLNVPAGCSRSLLPAKMAFSILDSVERIY